MSSTWRMMIVVTRRVVVAVFTRFCLQLTKELSGGGSTALTWHGSALPPSTAAALLGGFKFS
jgi:hypothetical protein